MLVLFLTNARLPESRPAKVVELVPEMVNVLGPAELVTIACATVPAVASEPKVWLNPFKSNVITEELLTPSVKAVPTGSRSLPPSLTPPVSLVVVGLSEVVPA